MKLRMSAYQKRVWKKTVSNLREEYGKYILFLFGGEVLGIFGLFLWQVSRLDARFALDNFLSNLVLAILINLGIVVLIVPWIRFFEAPDQIYVEQKKTLDYYQDRALRIELYNYQISFRILDSKISIPEIEILAKSTEVKKIVELEARIEFITQYALNNKNNLVIGGAVRDGNVIEGAEQVELRPDIPLPLKLATFSDDLSNLVLGKYGHNVSLLSEESIFNIKISFSGKLEGETEFRKTTKEIDLYANSSKQLLILASIAATAPQEFNKINPILFEKYKMSING